MKTSAKTNLASTSQEPFRSTLRHYLELIRFSHTIFALPFAILASVWAWILTARNGDPGPFSWTAGLGILVCMVAARSFAMAVNRLADAKYDAANPRTAGRHLPSGRLKSRGVMIFASACAVGFIVGTLLFLPNRLPVLLSIPVLLFLAGYSFAKRFTILVHFWLGTALALAPVCAWIALRGNEVMARTGDLAPAAFLGLGVCLWVAGFDLIYATQDAVVDRNLGLQSLPARLGVAGGLRIAALCHACMLIPFALIPWLSPCPGLGRIFWGGLLIVAILLIYEHSIVSVSRLEKVNVAFFQANAVISLTILTVGILDAWFMD